MNTQCIDILDYLSGDGSETERTKMEEHMADCDECLSEFIAYCEEIKASDAIDPQKISKQKAKSILSGLGLKGEVKRVLKWAKELFTPCDMFQPEWVPVRNSVHSHQATDRVFFNHSLDNLQAVVLIEKSVGNRVNIRAGVQEQNHKAKNVRMLFFGKGGKPYSRRLDSDFEIFEDLPYGSYDFILKQNNQEKGRCLININANEVVVE